MDIGLILGYKTSKMVLSILDTKEHFAKSSDLETFRATSENKNQEHLNILNKCPYIVLKETFRH